MINDTVKGIYSLNFIFASLALIVGGKIQDWANSNVSNYLFNTTVSEQFQDMTKAFARVETRGEK